MTVLSFYFYLVTLGDEMCNPPDRWHGITGSAIGQSPLSAQSIDFHVQC